MENSSSAQTSSGAQVELGELIETQKFGRFAVVLMTFASITMFLEGFEMQLVGYAAPVMIKALGVDRAAFGSIFGAGNFGFMIGALMLGNLGDRFGRRRLILSGVLLFSIFTLVAAYGTTLTELSALRFIAGIGLGGAVPNAIALTAEYAPRGRRAIRISFLYVAYTLGGAATGVVAARIMPEHGWPAVFLIGGYAGLIMFAVLWAFLPESARFLAQRKPDGAALRRIVNRLRPDVQLAEGVRITLKEEAPKKVEVAALFQDGRAPLTLLLWAAYIFGLTALQFMTSWLPTLVNGTGIAVSLAVLIGSLFHLGGTFGNVGIGWMVDRKGAIAIAVGFLIAVPIVAGMGPASTAVPTLMAAVFLAGFFIVGSQNGLNALSGMVYPTWMRSTGAGWTTGVGRIGSIIGPVLGGFLISFDLPISTLFLCVTVPLLLTTAAVTFLSKRTAPPVAPPPARPVQTAPTTA
jgi:MFS transporter, AAHS family, 4-hydroxybenzoate transporter